MSWWFDKNKRLQAAQIMQIARIEFLRLVWSRDKDFRQFGFNSSETDIASLLDEHKGKILLQDNTMYLL